ncbi:MAG: proline dehydrogenase family protein, partial [Candidatus Acidiferrales bacterium]
MPILRDLIFWLSTKKSFTNPIARTGMRLGFAKRFIAGETMDDGLRVAAELNAAGRLVIMNRLGEFVSERREAEEVCDSYCQMLQELSRRKVNGSISIKPTQLGLTFAPDLCRKLTLRVVQQAAALSNFVEVDMESSDTVAATVDLFEAVRRQHENVGLAVQSYLYRSEKDLLRLKPLHPKIRLVKGAYREPASVAYPKKRQVDENYVKLMRLLFSDGFWPAVATHDEKMITLAKQIAGERAEADRRWEFQMIFGVQRPLQEKLVGEGHRLRIYVPYGT